MIKIPADRELWFISDLHLNHKNICRGTSSWDGGGPRDFDTLEDMNAKIIESINLAVGENDILIHCGDVLFGPQKPLRLTHLVKDKINCNNIYHIKGNHDDWMDKYPNDMMCIFPHGVYDYLEIRYGKQLMCCFHYPMKVWKESHKGSWAITGHSHGSLPYEDHERGIDVGWDIHKRPLNFREIKEIMDKKVWEKVDHHDENTN